MAIPEKHQEFCKAVARLCRKHGLNRFGGSYTPDFTDDWRDQIQFVWEQGRHGEDSDKLRITSTVTVLTKLGPE